MRFNDILFPTQRITIPKTKDNLELEIQSIIGERKEFMVYEEIVTEKLIVTYKSKSFFYSFVRITELEFKGYEINDYWLVNFHSLNRNKNVIYIYLLFPIICIIFYFIFGHIKTILIGFLFGGIHFLLDFVLIKLDLLKWKRLFLKISN